MDFSYKKNDNSLLFSSLEKETLLNAKSAQNYIPLYSQFFTLTDANYNNINLNNPLRLYDITESISNSQSNNICTSIVIDSNDLKKETPVFFKSSPLLDPVKYMVGKYDISNVNLLNLPKHNSTDCHPKIRDPNNSAYVDGFFTYLTSQLLHKHGIIHGLDFYGSYLVQKNNFKVDVTEDLEYIYKSDFFHENKDKLFSLEEGFYTELINYDTRNYKEKLLFDDETLPENILKLSDISDLSELDTLFSNNQIEINKNEPVVELITEYDISNNVNNIKKKYSASSTGSNCSSRSSNSDDAEGDGDGDGDSDGDGDDDDDDDDETNDSDCSTSTEDTAFAIISQFPVQIIALEKCEKTLDHLLVNQDIGNKELSSIIIQILMILISFQNTFGLTHNDLHTNNIMYIPTEKQYLYYKVDNKHYKVPTFGRIFKIIDFGRAIYKFRGNVICSDSFHSKGDASTQYNFEPYFNKNKPRLEPNFSFDLCRLGCSMFDFFADDISDIKNVVSPIEKIIIDWCVDDKQRNVLYKNNGEERYPEFKLYKMIARTVHKHIPMDVLRNPHFESYVVPKKKINKTAIIMNIDNLPSYM